MKRIAFFDFDGTITTKDTLLEFIKFSKGHLGFWRGFIILAPFIIAYRLNLISNQTAKERVLQFFFGGMALSQFQELCENFARAKIPFLIRTKALLEIQKLQQAGAEVVVVSASGENWVLPWCKSIGVHWIATRFQLTDNKLTGKILGKNCHGEEKVCRIREVYSLEDYHEIYCYGDTKGDKPLLSLATFAFYKPFR